MSVRSFRRSAARLRRRSLRRAVSFSALSAFVCWTAFAAGGERGAGGEMCGSSCVVAAVAPSATGSRPAGDHTPAPLAVRRFDIATGPLPAVLESFRAVTGVRVELQLPPDTIGNFQSPGVAGLYTSEQALRELLTGTALSYRFLSPERAAIFIGESDRIDVTARAPEVMGESLPRYTEPLRDTPQSISVVPREVMQSQGTTTLRDVLRNVAGISIAAGEGGAQGDNLTIRGFSARNDLFVDGMRDFGSYYRDPFALEELEVLKGPSSVTFGRGSTGGVVNQALKSATLRPLFEGDVTFGSDATRRITADVNEPLPGLGEGTAVRLNVMGHHSGVAGRPRAENRRFGLAPTISAGLGTSTRFTLGYVHQSADDAPDYGVPWLFDAPAPVARSSDYGFRDANFLRTSADMATAKVEHEVNDAVRVRSQLRYAYYTRDVRITEARVVAGVTPSTPLEQVMVSRNQIAAKSDESIAQIQTDVTGSFTWLGMQHTLVAGVEGGRETSNPTRFAYAGVPVTSLLHPDPSQPFQGTESVSSRVRTTALSAGAYALDTLHVTPRWDVSAGVRWDRFDTDYRNSVGAVAAFQRVDAMPSWRGGVVFKPRPNGSVYADYSTSFNPSAESLSLSASTVDTDPEQNRNLELGTKWDLGHGRLSLRSALFRTEKLNAREPDPANPLQNILSGEQRVQGMEAEASGRITERWNVLASYAHMNSRLVKSAAFPSAVGARLANVPDDTFSLWSSIRLRSGLELGIGGQHAGSRTASSTIPLDPATGRVKEAPGYWVANAMVSRPLGDRLTLRLNLYNLTDAYYLDQLHPGHLVPGPARSALLTLGLRLGRAGAE